MKKVLRRVSRFSSRPLSTLEVESFLLRAREGNRLEASGTCETNPEAQRFSIHAFGAFADAYCNISHSGGNPLWYC